MYARVLSMTVSGIDGQIIDVETDVSNGLPQVMIVGLPDNSIRESSERVRTAIRNCGFDFPLARITINLAPADLRKEGAAYDLAIAAGILFGSGQLDLEKWQGSVMIGELALDGRLKPVNGLLSMVHAARQAGFKRVVVPELNYREALLIDGIEIIPLQTLKQLSDDPLLLNEDHGIEHIEPASPTSASSSGLDYGDVFGQQHAKRTMMIAASGLHNVLLAGPPGSGKTMLLRRLPTILPPLTDEEALEVMKIYSVAGQYRAGSGLWRERPFRSPHHTVSYAGMIGGGNVPRPGEVSLAHRGVLFLDELLEFNRQVLEVLRQPLEDRFVTIARAKATLRYPTSFLLSASMNPCPCGYGSLSSVSPICKCPPLVVRKYRSKLSGPLLDRIDLQTEVPVVKFGHVALDSTGPDVQDSDWMRSSVMAARERQLQRYRNNAIRFNSELSGSMIHQYCTITDDSKKMLRDAFNKLGLSTRALDRILKLSRTIADLEDRPNIEPIHVAEAIQYRLLDRTQL